MDNREIIAAAAAYIEQHLLQPLTAEQLASAAGFSTYHFCRLFSLYMEMPVMEYIRRRRLAHAASELCAGRTILDVAMEYGFESHNGFAKAFRKVYGYSPDEYRRRVGSHRPIAPNPLAGQRADGLQSQPQVQLQQRESFWVAGLTVRTSAELFSIACQPALWNTVWLGERENRIYAMARPREHGEYYMSFPEADGQFRLITCVKIDDPQQAEPGLYVGRVPAGLYGVFSTPPTDGDLAQAVLDTWRYIYDCWLPGSAYAPDPAGLDYEFYDERCHGAPYSMDICIPLIKKGD